MNKKLSVTLFNPASIEIGKIIIVCLYLVIWFAVIISFPSSLDLHPLIKSIIGWLWFLLPGLILSKILFKTLSWVEKIPVVYQAFIHVDPT